MLATDLIELLRSRGVSPTVTGVTELDITNPAAVERAVSAHDLVVNCAAFTAVDAAEEHEELAYSVNATGAGILARACAASDARLVHISTDYVFGGDATEPYPEDASFAPTSAYGRTKAAGEIEVLESRADALIVRTAWLYGAAGPSFPRTMLNAGRERGTIQVVNDQFGQPTWTRDLAGLILDMLEAEAPAGTYHGTSSGEASWYEFALAIVESAGLGDIVTPCSSSAYSRPAARPAYSVLGHGALAANGIAPIGNWRERWTAAAPAIIAAAD